MSPPNLLSAPRFRYPAILTKHIFHYSIQDQRNRLRAYRRAINTLMTMVTRAGHQSALRMFTCVY